MSPEQFRPTMHRIEVWSRAALVALALVAAPHLSAQSIGEPDDKGDDVQDQGRALKPTSGQQVRPAGITTVLSIPLTGMGVEATGNRSPTSAPAKPTVKSAASTGPAKPTVRNVKDEREFR
jgi:hypothetical protein